MKFVRFSAGLNGEDLQNLLNKYEEAISPTEHLSETRGYVPSSTLKIMMDSLGRAESRIRVGQDGRGNAHYRLAKTTLARMIHQTSITGEGPKELGEATKAIREFESKYLPRRDLGGSA